MAPMQATPNLPLYEDMTTILASTDQLSHKTGYTPQPNTTTTQQSPALLGQLNHRLQALNLDAPQWDIQIEPGTGRGVPRFIGSLTVELRTGEKIVVDSSGDSEELYESAGLPSKKDVKAVLARKALVALEGVSASPKATPGGAVNAIMNPANDGDGINWVGRVLGENFGWIIVIETADLTMTRVQQFHSHGTSCTHIH